jgi:hypothetical protein
MNDLYEVMTKESPRIWFNRKDLPYEMREIEGGLCEFDKYSRIFKKEGRTRSIFKHNKERPLIEDVIEGESKYVINGR